MHNWAIVAAGSIVKKDVLAKLHLSRVTIAMDYRNTN
jgi:hypothetical protein